MGYLLTGNFLLKLLMDKYEQRRIDLKALIEALGHGGIARVAGKIGKEPNYVSRMLYENGKPGRKRIGEESADLITAEFPNWQSKPENTKDHDESCSLAAAISQPQNQPLRPINTAPIATKNIATLAQILEGLSTFLVGVDAQTRKRAVDQLAYLAETPEDHAQVAAMMQAALNSANRKAA
jgi:hypothetical protein